MFTVQPEAAKAPSTQPDQREPHLATTFRPSPCSSWCGVHDHGMQDVAHRSLPVKLATPCPSASEDIAVRAELFRLDEAGETPTTAVLYVEGEAQFELTPAQADAFIESAQAFVDGLRVLRAAMEG